MRPAWVHGEDFEFPAPERATREGVVAIGGDVTPATLRRAYGRGIFPWPIRADLPMFWFSPNPRFILDFNDFHVPRSLMKIVRRGDFEVRFDTALDDVMEGCATVRRGESGTWIHPRLRAAFSELGAEPPTQGISVHSVEAWRGGALVGGLYGVQVGASFAGESMFFREPEASKVALVVLVERLVERGFHFVDCQVATQNLARFGAKEVPRSNFLHRLELASSDGSATF